MLYRHIENKHQTASIADHGKFVTVFSDDGWENMIDHRHETENKKEAEKYLKELGFELSK